MAIEWLDNDLHHMEKRSLGLDVEIIFRALGASSFQVPEIDWIGETTFGDFSFSGAWTAFCAILCPADSAGLRITSRGSVRMAAITLT